MPCLAQLLSLACPIVVLLSCQQKVTNSVQGTQTWQAAYANNPRPDAAGEPSTASSWKLEEVSALVRPSIAIGPPKKSLVTLKDGKYGGLQLDGSGPVKVRKAPAGKVLLVVAATVTSSTKRRLDLASISLSVRAAVGATLVGIGTAPGFARTAFVPSDVVRSPAGEIAFIENGKSHEILFGFGSEKGKAYFLAGSKPRRLFLAFEVAEPQDASFTLHFGDVVAAGTILSTVPAE